MGIYIYSVIPSLTWVPKIIILLVLAATFVFDIWVSVALVRGVKMLLGREPGGDNWQSIFNSSSHLIWPAFYTSTMIALVVLLGLILFFVPGVIFTVWYCFGYYAAILEGKSGTAALAHSKRMVVGRWWPIVLRLLAPFVLFMVIGTAIRYIVVLPVNFLPLNQFSVLLIQGLLATIVNILMAPLFYSSGLILYLSAKNTPLETAPQV